MIDDVDASVLALLQLAIPKSDAAVRFEAPTPDWVSALKGPCIDLFLHDVVEELGGRGADWTDVRGEDGRVVARQPPLRRYRLSYLVSAWASSAEVEHRLLGRVLRAVVEADNLPADVLVGSLVEDAPYVDVALAEPSPSRLRPHDLWSALGTPPRTSFELVVTAPLRPTPLTEVAPPAERLILGVAQEPRPALPAVTNAPDGAGAAGGAGRGRQKRSAKAAEQQVVGVSGRGRTGGPGGPGEKRWTSFRVRETPETRKTEEKPG
ncbi:MAG TPA: DUF4255 domain-containing protein [Acidimicrobiales bacterium]|nr:DUF4255 domain-containing protein [Acidimicrobiales bacterium]